MDSEIHWCLWWRPNKSHIVLKFCWPYHTLCLTSFLFRWGESAGAISASLHMLANGGNTEGLFRGSFMQSGSPIPVGDMTNGQQYYDAIVSQTGCSSASDTLACLRTVPYANLKAAINKSPGIFSYQVWIIDFVPWASSTDIVLLIGFNPGLDPPCWWGVSFGQPSEISATRESG